VTGVQTCALPICLALKRLLASGALSQAAREGNLHLLRLGDQGRAAPGPSPAPEAVTSPVSAVWYASALAAQVGQRVLDPQASGYGLLLAEDGQGLRRGATGNLLEALPGRDGPGLLVVGPGQMLPPGRYLARFRLRGGDGANRAAAGEAPAAALGSISLARRGQAAPLTALLAARDLHAADLAPGAAWVDLPLPFTLEETTWVEPRVAFAGTGPLSLNLVVVSFADQAGGPGAWPAGELFRQCGVAAIDPEAAGGQGGPAVLARAGQDPPLHLLHGP
jgi:hypothetical protein